MLENRNMCSIKVHTAKQNTNKSHRIIENLNVLTHGAPLEQKGKSERVERGL